jgi:glycosyltransferase involved in cell wall biosynthesis
MKIGWLRDFKFGERSGGAQLCEKLLREAVPSTVELIDCPSGNVQEADAYILLRCQTYSLEEIQSVVQKPCFHYVFDYWEWSNFQQRHLVMTQSRQVIFNSPLHKQVFYNRWGLGARGEILPPPIDVQHWLDLRNSANGRSGAMWTGEVHPYKGMDLAIRWATENDVELDVYGIGLTPIASPVPNVRILGELTDEQRDLALMSHESFLHFPRAPEGFSYSMLESWISGLEVIYSGRNGVDSFDMEWSELVSECSRSADKFWEMAEAAFS